MKYGQHSCLEFYSCYLNQCLSTDLFCYQECFFPISVHKKSFRTWYSQMSSVRAWLIWNFVSCLTQCLISYGKWPETCSSCTVNENFYMVIMPQNFKKLISLLWLSHATISKFYLLEKKWKIVSPVITISLTRFLSCLFVVSQ